MGLIASTTNRARPRRVVIVGAGVGGLTAACELQRRGVGVTLVERCHVGGCATTFALDGMAYDAGATLCFGLDHPGLLGGILSDLEIDLPHHRPASAWEVHGEGFSVGSERDTPEGLRPATVSVHAHRDGWPGRGPAYDARKAAAQEAVLELLAPHLPAPAKVITATPTTWVDFAGRAGRAGGRVGGFPAVAGVPPPLPPRLGAGVWLVGDGILPGQSTMAVALAGRTIAGAVLAGR